MQINTVVRPLLTTTLLTLAYVVTGKFGLTLAVIHPHVSSVWAPAGLAIGGLLTLGYRYWPAVFLGAFLVNVDTSSIGAALGIATGNTLEALVAVYLVNRFARGRRAFERVTHIFKFVMCAALLAPLISATIGVTSLALTGFTTWEAYWSIWLTWLLGNATGIVIIAPVVVLWYERIARGDRRRVMRDLLVVVAMLLPALLVSGVIFPARVQDYPLGFLAFPIVVWCAFRFGSHTAAAATLILTAVSIWRTLNGFGQFAFYPPNDAMILRQLFAAIVSLNGLLVGAVVAAWRDSLQSERWLATIVQHSNDAIVGKTLDGTILSWNSAAERLYGYAAREIVGRHVSALSPAHRLDETPQLLERIRRGEMIDHYETQRVRKDRTRVDVSLTISPIKDDKGNIIGASSIARELFRWPNREAQPQPTAVQQH